MKEFTFSVSAVLEYTVQAKTELQALKILVEKGGYDITYDDILVEKGGYDITYDDILVEREDYENAELIETREIEWKEKNGHKKK